jgi:uridine kinase
MSTFVVVTGIPRAGKSSLCDAIQSSLLGFTHIPLDRYVRPVPDSATFLDWIASPSCIAWDTLRKHIGLLEAGTPCYSPRPDWDNGWKQWLCEGGAIADGPGRRMEPARVGYLIPGTHAFALPDAIEAARVYVETPDVVVAERLMQTRVDPGRATAILNERLAPNLESIRSQRACADLVIDGTADSSTQVARFCEFGAARNWFSCGAA